MRYQLVYFSEYSSTPEYHQESDSLAELAPHVCSKDGYGGSYEIWDSERELYLNEHDINEIYRR